MFVSRFDDELTAVKLTSAERAWREDWQGQVPVIRSVDEALERLDDV